MKKRIGLLVLAALMVMVYSSSDVWAQKVIQWKCQAAYPLVSEAGKHSIKWAKAIERLTNGRLKVDVLPPGALCSVPDIYNYLEKGVIDASVTYGGFYTGLIPESDLQIGLPGSYMNWQEMWDGMYNKGLWKVIQDGYDKHDLLQWPVGGEIYYNFMTKFPVTKLEDFRGKKVRALGIWGKYAQALGASVVVVPGAEMYMALQLGTIDGAIYGFTGLQDIKLAEVVKYCVFPTAATVNIALVVSKKSLKKLPPDLKAIVEETGRYIAGDTGQDQLYNSYVSYIISEKKGQVTPAVLPESELVKVRKLIKPLYDELAAKSPNMAKGIDIIKQHLKELNRPID